MEFGLRPLPTSAAELCSVSEIARFLAERFQRRQPALLLRYGDTSGRVLARPEIDTPQFNYLRAFLGCSVTPERVDWLAERIEQSVLQADVIGLRSDLLGPEPIPEDFFSTPGDMLRERLCALYPIRAFERDRLDPDGVMRLGQTRRAMESMSFSPHTLLTDAWVHVSLAENGFLSALMRQAATFSVCTSAQSRMVLQKMTSMLSGRVRLFECPSHPEEEAKWGGDHEYLWQRWERLVHSMRPAYSGEPLLISAGIWTKVIGLSWAQAGGIAIDMGSVMDYFAQNASRPAVLATRYNTPSTVPGALSLESQLARPERLEDFLLFENG